MITPKEATIRAQDILYNLSNEGDTITHSGTDLPNQNIINKLVKERCVSVRTLPGIKIPDIKVYSITPRGRNAQYERFFAKTSRDSTTSLDEMFKDYIEPTQTQTTAYSGCTISPKGQLSPQSFSTSDYIIQEVDCNGK